MREIILAILVTACLLFGLQLRYEAIASVVSAAKKRILVTCYGTVLTLTAVGFSLWFLFVGPSIAAAKYGGGLFAVLTTAINILVIRNRIREHLFTFGIVIVCHYLLLTIPSYIYQLLEQSGRPLGGVAATVLYAFLLAVAFLPLRKLLKKTLEPFLVMDSSYYWNTIWFIPIALFGMLLVTFPGGRTVKDLSSVMGGVLCVATMILLCWRNAADHKEMRKKQLMEAQLNGQKLYYAKLQAKVEEARKTGHDFKHYAQAMRHYLSNDDMEGLRSCCIELTQQLNRAANVHDVGNSVADAVIYQYQELARLEGITVKIQGELNCDWIADMDVFVVLGNLLDNAIEGCKTAAEDRRLSLTFQHTDTTVCILIQNTYDGLVEMENGEMMSRKRERLSGVGLRSVETLCQKYRGRMDICHDETVFSVNLLLEKP